MGDAEVASDLAQQTFLEAFRCLYRLTDDRPFAAWLYRIARHQLLMHWRRQRLRRLVSLDWLVRRTGAAIAGLQRPDASQPAHERGLIQQVLDDLSPSYREALLLHSLCGFTSQEAAHILGASRWRVFYRVVVPLSLPGVIASSLIVFNLSMGAFTSAALIGAGKILTLPVLIQRTVILDTKYAMGATLSAVLLIAGVLINLLSIFLVSRLRAARQVTA